MLKLSTIISSKKAKSKAFQKNTSGLLKINSQVLAESLLKKRHSIKNVIKSADEIIIRSRVRIRRPFLSSNLLIYLFYQTIALTI